MADGMITSCDLFLRWRSWSDFVKMWTEWRRRRRLFKSGPSLDQNIQLSVLWICHIFVFVKVRLGSPLQVTVHIRCSLKFNLRVQQCFVFFLWVLEVVDKTFSDTSCICDALLQFGISFKSPRAVYFCTSVETPTRCTCSVPSSSEQELLASDDFQIARTTKTEFVHFFLTKKIKITSVCQSDSNASEPFETHARKTSLANIFRQ